MTEALNIDNRILRGGAEYRNFTSIIIMLLLLTACVMFFSGENSMIDVSASSDRKSAQ